VTPTPLIQALSAYNTQLVIAAATLLGIAAGVVGTFLLLRKRSLMGDALSHACLPGIGLAFLLLTLAGQSGKQLGVLLLGAGLSGMAGVALILLIRRTSPIKDDAAMGIVLSVFFGLGVVLLGLVQNLPQASAAGLEYFIYGKAASMVRTDFLLLASVTGVVLLATLLLRKELTLLCFDEAYASAQGWPVTRLDLLLLTLTAGVTVAGLQAVGLILIIAFLILPAAAARFWTGNLKHLLLLAGLIGGLSGSLGAGLSALLPGWPSGALIVLVATAVFAFSLGFGTQRGVLHRWRAHHRLRRKVGRQHLLRALYECLESQAGTSGNGNGPRNQPVPVSDLLQRRSWTPRALHQLIRQARREDHIEPFDGQQVTLSESGFGEAARTTRNHRLWEMYLITHADIAPSHVDRDADMVEHVLSPDMVHELEDALGMRNIPASPHRLTPERQP
jgi:manganese/zinc/iron transport system permease protein